LFDWTDCALHLFDTKTGLLREYEHALESVAAGWRPDGSECFVALGDICFRPKGALVWGVDRDVGDVSDSFLKAFRMPGLEEALPRPAPDIDIQGFVDSFSREAKSLSRKQS
jgi:hypothetical protein